MNENSKSTGLVVGLIITNTIIVCGVLGMALGMVISNQIDDRLDKLDQKVRVAIEQGNVNLGLHRNNNMNQKKIIEIIQTNTVSLAPIMFEQETTNTVAKAEVEEVEDAHDH